MISVGDRQVPWSEGMTVGDIIRQLAIPLTVLLEVNGRLVLRGDAERTKVSDGSKVMLRPIMDGG
jgi:thiamine biosynthesis protein ThiS